jgi:hypothetical protein
MISTTPKKPMENNSITVNVDVHRHDEHRTHDNDIIDHQTKVQTPRKRAYSELRNEGCHLVSFQGSSKANWC